MAAKKKVSPAKKQTTDKSRNKKKGSALVPFVSPTETPEEDDKLYIKYKREFDLYALWKSLPPMLRGVTPKDLEEKYFIDDEALIQLLQLRTQRAFADHFGFDEKTLYGWNKKLADRDTFADIRAWSNKLMKNVIMSTYRAAMLKDPKANSDRKLFLQFGGWGEEINVNNKGETLTELFKRGLGIE